MLLHAKFCEVAKRVMHVILRWVLLAFSLASAEVIEFGYDRISTNDYLNGIKMHEKYLIAAASLVAANTATYGFTAEDQAKSVISVALMIEKFDMELSEARLSFDPLEHIDSFFRATRVG